MKQAFSNISLLIALALLFASVVSAEKSRQCKLKGCDGEIKIKGKRKYGSISPARCEGSCPFCYNCKGRVSCKEVERHRGKITYVTAIPIGECNCFLSPKSCPSRRPRHTLELTDENGANHAGKARITRLKHFNNI